MLSMVFHLTLFLVQWAKFKLANYTFYIKRSLPLFHWRWRVQLYKIEGPYQTLTHDRSRPLVLFSPPLTYYVALMDQVHRIDVADPRVVHDGALLMDRNQMKSDKTSSSQTLSQSLVLPSGTSFFLMFRGSFHP